MEVLDPGPRVKPWHLPVTSGKSPGSPGRNFKVLLEQLKGTAGGYGEAPNQISTLPVTIRGGPEEEHCVPALTSSLSLLSGLLPPTLPHVYPNDSASPGPWRHHCGLSENSELFCQFCCRLQFNGSAWPLSLLLSLCACSSHLWQRWWLRILGDFAGSRSLSTHVGVTVTAISILSASHLFQSSL